MTTSADHPANRCAIPHQRDGARIAPRRPSPGGAFLSGGAEGLGLGLVHRAAIVDHVALRPVDRKAHFVALLQPEGEREKHQRRGFAGDFGGGSAGLDRGEGRNRHGKPCIEQPAGLVVRWRRPQVGVAGATVFAGIAVEGIDRLPVVADREMQVGKLGEAR